MSEEGLGFVGILRYFKGKKTVALAALLLIVGVGLMLFGGKVGSVEEGRSGERSAEELERKVEELCEGVIGVSDVRVMITSDVIGETLYAQNSQRTAELTRTEYVTSSGALMPTGERSMTVRGVAVVCRGGDNAEIRLKLTRLICALFDIGADSVSIVGGK